MSKGYVVLCGVPERECRGGSFKVQNSYRGSRKGHASRDEAFRCMVHFLKSQGFIQVGPREFKNPGDGPIRMLTKKSRFGSRMRCGKENTRFMYENGAGTIIG